MSDEQVVSDSGHDGPVVGLPAHYAFHDPRFVTWWLGSLHLFPIADQIAIAEALRAAIHTRDVQDELDAFISLASEDSLKEADSPLAATKTEVATDPDPLPILRHKLVELYRSNPWWVGVGVVGLVLGAGKLIVVIGRELFRIVF